MIGILGYLEPLKDSLFSYKANIMNEAYASALSGAGALCVMVPYTDNDEMIAETLKRLDGILVPGGADVTPSLYGEEKSEKCGETDRDMDVFQIKMMRKAVSQGKPVLGICRGMQLMNASFGGTLYQDLPTELRGSVDHSRKDEPEKAVHDVMIPEGDSVMRSLFPEGVLGVNSLHHQGIKKIAPGFRASAWAKDGLIEAIEDRERKLIGVQWHPEAMSMARGITDPIFSLLVSWAKEN